MEENTLTDEVSARDEDESGSLAVAAADEKLILVDSAEDEAEVLVGCVAVGC